MAAQKLLQTQLLIGSVAEKEKSKEKETRAALQLKGALHLLVSIIAATYII